MLGFASKGARSIMNGEIRNLGDLPEKVVQYVVENREETTTSAKVYTRECRRCYTTEYELDFQPASNTVDTMYVSEEGDESRMHYLEDTGSYFFHVDFRNGNRESVGEGYCICEHCQSDLFRRSNDGRTVYTVFEDGSKNCVLTRDGYVDTHGMPPYEGVDDWDNPLSVERNAIIAGEIPEDMVEVDLNPSFESKLVDGDVRGLRVIVDGGKGYVHEDSHDVLIASQEAMDDGESLEGSSKDTGEIRLA